MASAVKGSGDAAAIPRSKSALEIAGSFAPMPPSLHAYEVVTLAQHIVGLISTDGQEPRFTGNLTVKQERQQAGFTGNPTVKQPESETPAQMSPSQTYRQDAPNLETGILLGLLVGEGHFGGDGRQPQITLRMHTDHETLFRWLEKTFPGGKLYGPYHHGGRNYFQWMVRGTYLRETLVPLLDHHLGPELDAKAYQRYQEMKRRYNIQ